MRRKTENSFVCEWEPRPRRKAHFVELNSAPSTRRFRRVFLLLPLVGCPTLDYLSLVIQALRREEGASMWQENRKEWQKVTRRLLESKTLIDWEREHAKSSTFGQKGYAPHGKKAMPRI